MFELLINPKRAERQPWHMFIVGLLYGGLAMFLTWLFFSGDFVNSQYMGWILVLFCVLFSFPFIYYMIKLEERRDDEDYENEGRLLFAHRKALYSFMWLFLGFIVAFSIIHMILPRGNLLLKTQIEVFCQMNNKDNYDICLSQYGFGDSSSLTGTVTSSQRLLRIFENNAGVLIFTIILSLIFGTGAIFILAWNASVIAAAIGIFSKMNIMNLPIAVGRFMIHGVFEIAAYFIAALAGGILSIAIIRREYKTDRFWTIVEDFLALIIVALVILAIAAAIEVFITPRIFQNLAI